MKPSWLLVAGNPQQLDLLAHKQLIKVSTKPGAIHELLSTGSV